MNNLTVRDSCHSCFFVQSYRMFATARLSPETQHLSLNRKVVRQPPAFAHAHPPAPTLPP